MITSNNLDFSHIKLASSLTTKAVKNLEEDAKRKIIDDFISKLKEERGSETHYLKNGVKKKLSTITFMSIKMRLIAIKEVSQLEAFYQDCLKHTDFKDFTTYFNVKTYAK